MHPTFRIDGSSGWWQPRLYFVVHLSFVGLAGLLVACKGKKLCILFLIRHLLKLNSKRHSLPRLELDHFSDLLYTPDFLKSCCYSGLNWTIVKPHTFSCGYDIYKPLGESYSGIHALADLSVCVNLYQQAFWRRCRGNGCWVNFEPSLTLYHTLLSFYFFILFFYFPLWIPLLSVYMLHPQAQA
jgi:hypothetical protein